MFLILRHKGFFNRQIDIYILNYTKSSLVFLSKQKNNSINSWTTVILTTNQQITS